MRWSRLKLLLAAFLLLAVQLGRRSEIDAQSRVSIYEVQYAADARGDSPYEGETVSTSGVVFAIGTGACLFLRDRGGEWEISDASGVAAVDYEVCAYLPSQDENRVLSAQTRSPKR